MKLSTKEADILACVELRADLSIDEIRKDTGYRDHTIRYALKRLMERNVIVRMPFINLGALGYTMHNIFFSMSSESKRVKQQVIRELRRTKEVVWVAEMGGDFQYAVDICARHLSEVQELLNNLSEKVGNIFFQKMVSSQFSATRLPRSYLSSKKFKAKPLSLHHPGETVEIDELDDRILQGISQNGHLSHRRVAQQLGVPLSTLELRVRKLKERGVLLGHIFGVDVSQYHYESFKLIVYGKGVNPKLTKELFQYCWKHDHIVSFYECFGAWDYELGVEVAKAQDVVNVMQELYEAFGGELNTIKVLTKFSDVKFSLYPG